MQVEVEVEVEGEVDRKDEKKSVRKAYHDRLYQRLYQYHSRNPDRSRCQGLQMGGCETRGQGRLSLVSRVVERFDQWEQAT